MTGPNPQHVLLADIGGTNVRFGLAAPADPAPLDMSSIRAYLVAESASLADATRRYLGETGLSPEGMHAVFAVAGRVVDGDVRMTNHPWDVSAADTRRQLGLRSLRLVNDFAALGMCLTLLSSTDLRAIGTPGAPTIGATADQTFLVIGPGTGLGVGGLLIRNGISSILVTEGGHAGFAPVTTLEMDILQRLQARFGRVSNERLLSGEGLVNLYSALCGIDGVATQPFSPEDIVAQAASDATCARTLETFCDIYGAIAGDFVLAFGAWNGVYLAGGLTSALLPWLQRGGFRERFEDKGRFSAAMAQVATLSIAHPYAGLLGAAAVAVRDIRN